MLSRRRGQFSALVSANLCTAARHRNGICRSLPVPSRDQALIDIDGWTPHRHPFNCRGTGTGRECLCNQRRGSHTNYTDLPSSLLQTEPRANVADDWIPSYCCEPDQGTRRLLNFMVPFGIETNATVTGHCTVSAQLAINRMPCCWVVSSSDHV